MEREEERGEEREEERREEREDGEDDRDPWWVTPIHSSHPLSSLTGRTLCGLQTTSSDRRGSDEQNWDYWTTLLSLSSKSDSSRLIISVHN